MQFVCRFFCIHSGLLCEQLHPYVPSVDFDDFINCCVLTSRNLVHSSVKYWKEKLRSQEIF